ncbi:MAG: hypothetical protein LBF67_07075 [Prevotellaceae bacterium]|jgi:hypothetical protein|nr:hypothetical protein [Prevotellaceae bacterium]
MIEKLPHAPQEQKGEHIPEQPECASAPDACCSVGQLHPLAPLSKLQGAAETERM